MLFRQKQFAYSKFSGILNKPDFGDIAVLVTFFLVGYMLEDDSVNYWDKEKLCWTYKA